MSICRNTHYVTNEGVYIQCFKAPYKVKLDIFVLQQVRLCSLVILFYSPKKPYRYNKTISKVSYMFIYKNQVVKNNSLNI